MRKRINEIFSHILNILLILVSIIIIIGVYYIFQIKIMGKQYANLFGYTFFEVATGSMSPTLEIGDVIFVKVNKDDVSEDDIIVYKEDNNFITHRLIQMNEEEIIAKGDANNSKDKPIKKEDILGKVVKVFPKVGIWKKVMLQPEIITLIVVLITIFGVAFVYSSDDSEVVNGKTKNDKK